MGLDGTSSLPGAVGQAPLHPWGPLGGCLVTVHRITMLPWRLGVILLLVMRGQSADTQGDAVLTSEAGGRWGLWARLTAGTCPQHPPLHLPPPFPPLPLLTVIFPPQKKKITLEIFRAMAAHCPCHPQGDAGENVFLSW